MDKTENKLRSMFEYQRFDGSSRLAKLIQKTESRYNRMIDDDDLEFVAAAGVTQYPQNGKADEKKPF